MGSVRLGCCGKCHPGCTGKAAYLTDHPGCTWKAVTILDVQRKQPIWLTIQDVHGRQWPSRMYRECSLSDWPSRMYMEVVMGNSAMCDERVTRASPLWHPNKIETWEPFFTTQFEHLCKTVNRTIYIMSTILEKDLFYFILLPSK